MIKTEVFNILDDKKILIEALEQGKSIQEVLGFSNEQMGEFYQYGCELFRERRFEDASDLFYLLSFFNPHFFEVWFSYGLSEQNLDRWESAISAFQMAMVNKIDDPRSYLHCAFCAEQLGDKDSITYFIHLMENVITDVEKFKPVEKQITYFKKLVGEKKEEGSNE